MEAAKFVAITLLRILPLLAFVTGCSSEIKHLQSESERHYVDIWCADKGGETEVTLRDKTRVDCLTETHAIEGKFAKKWKAAIGQATHYAVMTKKNPGILLILERQKSCRYLSSLKNVLSALRINDHLVKVWTTGPASEKCSKWEDPFVSQRVPAPISERND